MNALEQKVIEAAIRAAIADHCRISVFDGESNPVKDSIDVPQIIAGLGHCDEEWVILETSIGNRRVGSLYLVYGNDPDEVIADYSWSETHDADGSRLKAIYEAGLRAIEV
jgi:hypothetical protein